MHRINSLICMLLQILLCTSYRKEREQLPSTFHLIKRCQRSLQNFVGFDNVATLDECFRLAERSRALALNYSPLRGIRMNLLETNDSKIGTSFPRRSTRRHYLDQPEQLFNCHALRCPESSAFTTMINDTRFDYYSLYGTPPEAANFVCVPEIGIFYLQSKAENYSTAFQQCNQTNGALAHITTEIRTFSLSKLLQENHSSSGSLKLAYIGLNYTATLKGLNSFQTSDKEDLNNFLYRAWAPGHPKMDNKFSNQSCVALTADSTWMTIDCGRKLSFICEIYTSPLNVLLYEDACDKFININ